MKKSSPDSTTFPSLIPRVVGFGSILLLLGGFTAWAVSAGIDGAVLANGQIVVDRNRQAVQHAGGGIVGSVLVEEGDSVTENDLLIRLDPTLTQSELTIVEGQLFELMARRGRLEAERDDAQSITFDPLLLETAKTEKNVETVIEGQRRLFEARRESLENAQAQLNSQKEQLANEINGVDSQVAALEQQQELTAEEMVSQETLLSKGLAQRSRVTNLKREMARLAGLKGELVARRARSMQRIAETNIQELTLHSQRREEAISILRDLQFSEMEMVERRNSLQTQLNWMDIRAPVSGVIYDLRVFGNRSVIRPADPIMFIVPQNRPLVISIEINTIDITKVFLGQEVVLKFSSFDVRNTPDLIGQVTRVSPDSFTDSQSGRSFYRAEVELPETELEKLSADQVLIPGMPVEAFVKTGEHTPMTYLTSPITRYFQKAMRENG